MIDPADLATHGQMDAPEQQVLLYEFKDGINRYLTRLPSASPARTLQDLIAFNEKNRDREMPFFAQELFIQSEAKGPLTEAAYLKARADCVRLSRQEGIDALLGQTQAGRDRDAHLRPRLAHRSHQWRYATPAAAPRPRPSPAIRTSRSPPDSIAACPSACRSSPPRGASRRCSSWPTPGSSR